MQKTDLAKTSHKGISFSQFLTTLPNILAGHNFLTIVERIIQALHEEKGVILAMGAHVINIDKIKDPKSFSSNQRKI